MGATQSVATAGAKAVVYNTTGRAPLRLNLQRQYMLKEYLEVHGGHGPGATPKQVVAGLLAAFALTGVWTVFQKAAFNHDVPKTLAPEYKAAEKAKRKADGHTAISDHRIGQPVVSPLPTDPAARKAMVDEDKAKR